MPTQHNEQPSLDGIKQYIDTFTHTIKCIHDDDRSDIKVPKLVAAVQFAMSGAPNAIHVKANYEKFVVLLDEAIKAIDDKGETHPVKWYHGLKHRLFDPVKKSKDDNLKDTFDIAINFCEKHIKQLTPNDSFTTNSAYDRDRLLTEIYNDKFLQQYSFVCHSLDLPSSEEADVTKAVLRRKRDQLQLLIKQLINDPDAYKEWYQSLRQNLHKQRRASFEHNKTADLDSIPDETWFDHDPLKRIPSTSSNAYLALKRLSEYAISYDEWEWKTRVTHNGKQQFINKMEARRLFWPVIRSKFGFELRREHFEDGLEVWSRKNTVNSRKDFLMEFRKYYDPDYDYLSTMMMVLNCEDNDYARNVAHMLLVGHVQRTFFPGCILKRLISLIGEQNSHRSTFCKVLACGSRNEADLRWFTDRNIFDVKNEFTRVTIIRGIAVFEFAERTGMSRFDLDHYKNELSSTVDRGRIMRTEEPIEIPRSYDIIATTNRTEILYDTQNVREFPLETGIVDNDLFVREYQKIMGRVVHGVLHEGWSGAPSEAIMTKAREIQDAHRVESDLTGWLKMAVAFTHISGMSQSDFDELMWAFRISRNDHKRDVIIGGIPGTVIDKYVYVTNVDGLSTFVAEYRKYHSRMEVRIDKSAIKDAMEKVRIELDNGTILKWTKMDRRTTKRAVMLKTSLRGWFMEVEGGENLVALNRFATDILMQEQRFINHLVTDIFEMPRKTDHVK